MENIKKKNFYIYLGLSLFIFLAIAPWILTHELSSFLLRSFNAYLAIVISFIAGSLWWRDNLIKDIHLEAIVCLLYTSPSPRDKRQSRMPSSA